MSKFNTRARTLNAEARHVVDLCQRISEGGYASLAEMEEALAAAAAQRETWRVEIRDRIHDARCEMASFERDCEASYDWL